MAARLNIFPSDGHLESIRLAMEKVSACLEQYRTREQKDDVLDQRVDQGLVVKPSGNSSLWRSSSAAAAFRQYRSKKTSTRVDGLKHNLSSSGVSCRSDSSGGESSGDEIQNLKKELTTGKRCKMRSRLDWVRSPFVFSIRQQTIETIEEEPDPCCGRHGGSKRNSSSDGSSYNGTPPPLPPRLRKGPGSEKLKKQKGRKGKHRGSLPSVVSEHPMVSTSTLPKSHSLGALRKRFKSTSSLPVMLYDGPISSTDMLAGEVTPVSPVSTTSDFGTQDDSCESPHVSTLSESLPGNRDYFHSISCPHADYSEFYEENLDKLDIVGESYDARFPWQRDVSTQCNMAAMAHRSNLGSSSIVKVESNVESAFLSRSDGLSKKKLAFKQCRPHSIGCMENVMQESELKKMRENGRRSRNSEPFIQHHSALYKKRMPLLVMDDPGSVSDLESILESPVEGTIDVSRSSSLNDEDESGLGDELRHLGVGEKQQEGYNGVLPSPRVSPDLWKNVPDVVVNTATCALLDGGDKLSLNGNNNYLSVPVKSHRLRNSGSLTSGSDESDCEPSPPVARRGRRPAIVDTKNFGDVSPTTLSPDVSPSNSCDEGDSASNIAGRLRRRRSSVDLAMNIYPGDLLVQEHHKKLIKRNTISDFYSGRNGSSPVLTDESKKARQTFSLLKLMKTRSKDSLTQLGDVLAKLKPSEFKDNHLAAYKNFHWSDLTSQSDRKENPDIPVEERKRRESVWELFKSECVFLIDHLMVLKHCFLEPLKKVQVEGCLMYAEPSDIFSNLDELCYVSYTFCKDFIAGLVRDLDESDFGATNVLIKALQRFSTHSKDGGLYHTYCLNYTNALSYLEKLRKNDDFCEFEKWCEQDPRCNRLQLADLLISPMQHCTKLPLLLNNIKKYTRDPGEKQQIADSIQKVELSLQQLENKMMWLKNFERVQEIQRQLVWPVVTELDTRAFVPEFLKQKVLRQPCGRLLACPSRQLIHEGPITLTESTKTSDAYLFLFDDILLITKVKKSTRKKQSSSDQSSQAGQSDSATYIVHRQPIALDRFGLHDVCPAEAAANGLKYAFVLVQISRFQQIIDVFTLQATSEIVKNTWIAHINETKNKYNDEVVSRSNSLHEESSGNGEKSKSHSVDTNSRRLSGSSVKRGQPGKAASIEAVFL